MEESKKDKYKSHQTKKDTKVPKKDDIPEKGETIKDQVRRTKNQNSQARAWNDYSAMTGKGRPRDQYKRSFGPKSKVPKIKYEAGSEPSGTNTHLPNWGKRKDGSSGPC
jgi:hypothetical protein